MSGEAKLYQAMGNARPISSAGLRGTNALIFVMPAEAGISGDGMVRVRRVLRLVFLPPGAPAFAGATRLTQ